MRHDDGELLQEAVTEAIRRGDAEMERLAARAAAESWSSVHDQ